MYKISVRVGKRMAAGVMEGENLSFDEIQAKGWGILGQSVKDKLPKGKKAKLPRISYEYVPDPVVPEIVSLESLDERIKRLEDLLKER